jgi:Protein of unknown function (DUF3592)
MSPNVSHRGRRRNTSGDYRTLQVLLWCLLLLGPAFIFVGVLGNYHDRPSLQWPTVSGTIMQSEWVYHHGSHQSSYYYVHVAYAYHVNGETHVGNRVKLWNPDFNGDESTVKDFVAAHPVRSTVDVYYDPAHPENSVLIPGANEDANRIGIWCGSIIFVLIVWSVFRTRKYFAEHIAATRAKEAKLSHVPRIIGLPHAFISYEPGSGRKLNCFPDQDCLDQVLGHDDKKIQDWKPDDRIIGPDGKEYRLLNRPEKKCYDLELTGETWSLDRLLEAAEADARLIKQDANALRQRVNDAPAEQRMAVLMKCIDDLPAFGTLKAKLFLAGFILFLILFFLAVVFGVGKVISWFGR